MPASCPFLLPDPFIPPAVTQPSCSVWVWPPRQGKPSGHRESGSTASALEGLPCPAQGHPPPQGACLLWTSTPAYPCPAGQGLSQQTDRAVQLRPGGLMLWDQFPKAPAVGSCISSPIISCLK